MTKMTAHEAWEGFVGSQTPAEFMDISRQQGQATVDEAVAAYITDIPSMFGQRYSAEELEEIGRLLAEYINSDILCTVGRQWDKTTQALDWYQHWPVVNSRGIIVAVIGPDGTDEYDFDDEADCYRVREG